MKKALREPSGGVFVRHESSGGDIEHVQIGAFLSGDGPEQQALLGLIGTLVEEHHVGSYTQASIVSPGG